MNWKRILLFIGLTFVATLIAGFVPGLIRGFYNASGSAPPSWIVLLQGGLVPLAIFLVFVRLGRVQREQPWQHAALVWLGAVVLSFLNFLFGQPLSQFLIGIAISAIMAAAGMGFGLWRQPKPDRSTSEPAA
jgi:hypothetical protein